MTDNTTEANNCEDCSLSVLVHAASKAGKSTLGSTAPRPIIVLDVEGSWRFISESGYKTGIKLRKTYWDPMQGPPPRHDDTWEICMVKINRWEQLVNVLTWLTQAPHDFRSLVIDSISEAQRRLKANIKSDSVLDDFRQWGALLAKMDTLIRGYRDLVLLPETPLQTVVFIAETKLRDGMWRPTMQGQIADQLPYWVDVVGYLYADKIGDEHGTNTRRVNRLLIEPNETFVTGERVQGRLPGIITEPRIDKMLTTIFSD